jgi:hypothetical protein
VELSLCGKDYLFPVDGNKKGRRNFGLIEIEIKKLSLSISVRSLIKKPKFFYP